MSRDAWGREAARILYRLVSIYSPTGREEGAVKAFLGEAERLGLEAWSDGVGNAFAAPPRAPGKPVVALVSHVDTVEGWVEPGYSGGAVWGRGAVDAKGPLSAMLAAVAALARLDPEAPVAVAGLVGEEGDSRGARFLAEHGPHARFIVIGEPTGGDGVVIGYRGSFRLRVTCEADGGHSASPWAGSSALDLALQALEAVRSLYPPEGVSRPTLTPVLFKAGDGSNVIPRSAVIVFDSRIPAGWTPEGILAEVSRAIPEGCKASIAGGYTPPVRVSLNDPVPRALVRTLLEAGARPRPSLKAGTSDMNLLAGVAESIAAYGPGDPSLAHTPRERVTEAELGLAVEVYARAALRLTRSSRG
ncbi:M20/M25/M40 family metallo-hydrolase [Stetteria hydrogenophila]